jgi:hypothetical protein
LRKAETLGQENRICVWERMTRLDSVTEKSMVITSRTSTTGQKGSLYTSLA